MDPRCESSRDVLVAKLMGYEADLLFLLFLLGGLGGPGGNTGADRSILTLVLVYLVTHTHNYTTR